MDLTPDVLHQQEFREARRGYDMREVDEFLERVAVAVDELLVRLQRSAEERDAARARVVELEQAPAPTPQESADETIQRTLLLAQKTADAAVSDAEAQAAKVIERAEQQAGYVIKEAESAAERARIEAESQARRAGEETRRRMLEEITTLERTREQMHGDVRALRRYLDDQRTRMRTAARDLQRLVEDPTALKEFSPPLTSDQREEIDAGDGGGAGGGDVEPAEVDAGAADQGADDDPALSDLPPPPPADATAVAADDPAEPTAAVHRDPTEPTAAHEGDDPDDPDRDEDYFDELRRAMNDGDGEGVPAS